MRKVAAVVVTYNRLEKLKKVLASLESQTRLPQMLVIVNNAATDGTAEYLQEYAQRFALSDSMQLDIVTLEKNEGGAGGFSAGMRRSYELGADYAWIFDDDGYPEPDALDKLVLGYDSAVAELGPDVPFACRNIVGGTGEEDLLRLGGGLDGNAPARKVAKGLNVAVLVDGHHLPADHIGSGPLVVILPAIHGKAAPDAVDVTLVHQFPFPLPVDGGEGYLIAHAAQRLPGNLNVQAGDVAVVVHVDIGRVGIAADDELGQRGVRFLLRRAAAKQSHDHQAGQHKSHAAFHPFFSPILKQFL